MNYSHYSIVKKQKKLRSPSRRIFSLLRIWLMRIGIVVLAFGLVAGCFGAYGAYKGIIATSPSIDSISVNPELFASVIYYSDGTEIVQLAGAGTSQQYAKIDEIPEEVRNCFVAMEDERFYDHNGIDIRGIFRAAFSVVKDRDLKYGASTITQQLLKNQVFSGGNEKSKVDKIIRKVQEQYLAVRLEDKLEKDTILEYYLNTINLGNGAYGIASAAERYFGKDVSELTISEAAVIAPVAYSPTLLNPLRDEDRNRIRRENCLNNLLNAGFCTPDQYDEAIADTDAVYERLRDYAATNKIAEKAQFSYFVDELIDQLLIDLQAKGYSQKEATSLLYTGGLQIYTTQDREIQEIMDGYFTDESNFPAMVGQKENGTGKAGSYSQLSKSYALSIVGADNATAMHYHLNDLLDFYKDYKDTNKVFYHEKSGAPGISIYTTDLDTFKTLINNFVEEKKALFEALHPNMKYTVQGEPVFTLQPQCAMVIMDQANGHVVAQYGGRGEKVGNRVLNRASDAYRQAGSTFKVLASFLPALDAANYTLASVFDDYYYKYPGGGKVVNNWYSGFKGLSTIRQGIWDSRNIVACRCCQAVGATTCVNYLLRLGFSKIDTDQSDGKSDYNVAIALGGLTNGCSVLEMTAAYAAIANGGKYNKPVYYTEVLDHEGNVLLQNVAEPRQVMKATTAWLLTDAMIDTTKIGTGSSSRLKKVKIDVAGKTGTAHDNYDLWFAGFTKYYTSAIWSGFDEGFEQANTMYYRYMWRNIMDDVHVLKQCQEGVKFDRPAGITSATVCTKCGKLAVEGLCDQYEGDKCVRSEYFAAGTAPHETCTCHVKLAICAETGELATDGCTNIIVKVFLNKVETKEALEHGGTEDTKYIMPEDKNHLCSLHSGVPIDPEKPLPTKAPTPTPTPAGGGATTP